jgi:transposase-like protein
MEKRNRYTSEFKAKLVLELIQEESTLNQVASKYQLNPQMLSQWKSEFFKRLFGAPFANMGVGPLPVNFSFGKTSPHT